MRLHEVLSGKYLVGCILEFDLLPLNFQVGGIFTKFACIIRHLYLYYA